MENKKISFIYYCLFLAIFNCLVILFFMNYRQNNRLDEHKKVIELQQKQINQLIIHCEYERNRKNNN